MKKQKRPIVPAILGVAAALALVFFIKSNPTPKGPSRRVVATVTYVYLTGYMSPPRIIINAHVPHAIDEQTLVRYGDESRCRVGDEVDGTVTGITLRVDPHTCRRPGSHK
jgi:hypothetical protein